MRLTLPSYKHLLPKKALWTVIIVSLTAVGCEDSSKHDKPTLEVTIENVHVGTDIDIQRLKPISDAYQQQTGVIVEWVALDSSNIIEQRSKVVQSDVNLLAPNDDEAVFGEPTNEIEPAATIQTDIAKVTNTDIQFALPPMLDMLFMRSAYTMKAASKARLLQPIGSATLIKSVPAHYQNNNGEWFGLAYYGRTIVYNRHRVSEASLTNYAGLADEQWLGRLCMTALNRPENQALIKAIISHRGRAEAEALYTNWLINMDSPLDNDEQVLEKIQYGGCDVGIVDSDVFWRYATSTPDTPVRLMWANQLNQGTVVDTLSAGLTKSGNDVGRALEFMEWLVSDKAQALLAFTTSTLPVVAIEDDLVNLPAIQPKWMMFKADTSMVTEGRSQKAESSR